MMHHQVDVITIGDSPLTREPETPRSPRRRAIPVNHRKSRNLFGSKRQAECEKRQPSSAANRKRSHSTESIFNDSGAPEHKRNKLDEEHWEMARKIVEQMNSATKRAHLRENRSAKENKSTHSDEDERHDYAKTVFAYRYRSESPDEKKRSPRKMWPQTNFYGGMDPVQEQKKPAPVKASSPKATPAKPSWIKMFNCQC